MRACATILTIGFVLALSGGAAHAKDRTGSSDAEVDDGGSIGTEAGSGPHPGAIYTSGGGSGPKCSWDRLTVGEWGAANGVADREPPEYDDDPDVELDPAEIARRDTELADWQRNEAIRVATPATAVRNGITNDIYGVRCPGRAGNIRFVPQGTDATDLIPGVYDAATGQITLPVPDVSPPFDVPGYVNLGMWLAVEPVTMAPITAEAGPHWITVSPTHDSIDFDFGNGDTTSCDGFGEPIVDLETFDEGPCGYTYREKLPDDAAYIVTVGTTWNLPYDSSAGGGTLPPFTRNATFEHNVDELQTIGRSN